MFLSDKQIAALCTDTENPMITPFVAQSVKVNENGERIMSYGLSSFGYDVRIAPEFRIFTNALTQLVDPKNFDKKSFVEVNEDHCIIPPNSFVLARTLERFKMPKDVVGIVLGKSTIARVGINCFTGNTRVRLVDGSSINFTQLFERNRLGDRFYGYSVDAEGNVVSSELTMPQQYGKKPVLHIRLSNGKFVEATHDHKFMLIDRTYREAKDLAVGIELMPLLYDYKVEGRDLYRPVVMHPIRGQGIFVMEIKEMPGEYDVYCLTVPVHHNFALDSGVFVHNCLATPLEPGWEGYLTLEFANTTPLPAKLYANEGGCQILFAQNPGGCLTTYADRSGKYQGQAAEIVLPRI